MFATTFYFLFCGLFLFFYFYFRFLASHLLHKYFVYTLRVFMFCVIFVFVVSYYWPPTFLIYIIFGDKMFYKYRCSYTDRLFFKMLYFFDTMIIPVLLPVMYYVRIKFTCILLEPLYVYIQLKVFKLRIAFCTPVVIS